MSAPRGLEEDVVVCTIEIRATPVVRSLLRCVQSLSIEDAVAIMMIAHENGQASVIECPKEAAEHYRDALESCGLTATIEPA